MVRSQPYAEYADGTRQNKTEGVLGLMQTVETAVFQPKLPCGFSFSVLDPAGLKLPRPETAVPKGLLVGFQTVCLPHFVQRLLQALSSLAVSAVHFSGVDPSGDGITDCQQNQP